MDMMRAMPTIKPRIFAVTAMVGAALVCLAGCGKKEPATQATPPAQPKPVAVAPAASDFEAVTSQLDKGGDLYAYLGTGEALRQFSSKAAPWREVIQGLPNVDAQASEQLTRAFTLVTNLVRESGLESLRGVGMSSLPLDDSLRRSKLYLYYGQGGNAGFLWNLLGAKQHSLEMLNLLPASTSLAMVTDADLKLFWSVLERQLAKVGVPEVDEMLRSFPQQFETATRLQWEAVLGCLGGQYGIVITLDETRTVSIPIGDDQLEIPEPALMLVAKVNDDTLFKRLDDALKESGQSVFAANRPGLQMRTLAVPVPLPLQVGLTVAQSEGYLFLATTDQVVLQALAARAGEGKKLTATDEFKRLSKDIPLEGNQFMFVGERLGQTVRRLQRQALRMAESMGTPQQNWLRSVMQEQAPAVLFAVGSHQPQGWLWVSNGSRHPGSFLLSSALLPAAAFAGMAIPNMSSSPDSSARQVCRENIRAIEAAKSAWALETDRDTDAPKVEDLLPYLLDNEMPVCPEGGEYSISAVSVRTRCSNPDHNE